MVISDFIGSPSFAGDHLSFFSHRIGSPGTAGDYLSIPSASRLLGFHHLGFLLHHKTQWVSVAPPAPPDLDLGISVAPFAPPTLGDSQFPLQLQLSVSICGSRAASGSWLLLQHRQASLVPFSLWWLSAFTAGLGIVFQPFCSFSSDCFLLLVKYYSLFCLICKLGYLLSICILATAWLFWVILLLFFYYG